MDGEHSNKKLDLAVTCACLLPKKYIYWVNWLRGFPKWLMERMLYGRQSGVLIWLVDG
jgi:hypothetical protein